ncbi:MAG: YdcF family protein [Acidimicrobiales bacterium]
MSRVPRMAWRAIWALVILAGLYGLVTYAQVATAARRDGTQPAPAIVVFGAAQFDGRPSAVLRARLDHAADLYRRRLAPVVVVTGGSQPGDRVTEATASADYLLARGIPERAILREVSGHSSWQSLSAAVAILDDRDIHEALLVSDAFHSLRLGGIASELGLKAHLSPTPTSPIVGWDERRAMARETLAVGIGRIVGFRRQANISEAVRERATTGPADKVNPPSGVV